MKNKFFNKHNSYHRYCLECGERYFGANRACSRGCEERLLVGDYLEKEDFVKEPTEEGYVLNDNDLKDLIHGYMELRENEMVMEVEAHLEKRLKSVLVDFLLWMNALAEQQPMRLETDNEDIAMMYIHDKDDEV